MRGFEYLTITVPSGFDPERHGDRILAKVSEEKGPGFVIDEYDPINLSLTVKRAAATTIVSASDKANTKLVGVTSGTKPSEGDRIAVSMADKHPGYYMTEFNPFSGYAVLSKMTEDELRCRAAVAEAIGCKPWDVKVNATDEGGFKLQLPSKYTPSKHDDKLEEVATTVVGFEGWYVTINPKLLTAEIVPSDPPTFPPVIHTPLNTFGHGDVDVSTFGMILPAPGEQTGPPLTLDWTASAWALIGGQPGAGKSVSINAIIAEAVSNGSELVVIDIPAKSVDFEWCKPFVRDGGWGCDSAEAAIAAIGLVYDEGARRASILRERGINNWLAMPPEERFTPILVVIDELSALVVAEPTPKGIPKTHPVAMEVAERNLQRAILMQFIRKTVAELRFVGVRMILSTQATNANTGVDPALRTLIGHKVLQGTNPSKAARGQIFSDETAVPTVPEHVKESGLVGRGVGVVDLEGQRPAVYKSFFATTQDYANRLAELGVPISKQPEPTGAQIDKYVPTLDDDGGLDAQPERQIERAPSGRPAAQVLAEARANGDDWDVDPETGKPLSGFAKANAARRAVVQGGS